MENGSTGFKVKHVLFQYGFGYAVRQTELVNEKVFLAKFEQRLKHCFYQTSYSDVQTSDT